MYMVLKNKDIFIGKSDIYLRGKQINLFIIHKK